MSIACIDDEYFYYNENEDLIGPFNSFEEASDALVEYMTLNNL